MMEFSSYRYPKVKLETRLGFIRKRILLEYGVHGDFQGHHPQAPRGNDRGTQGPH